MSTAGLSRAYAVLRQLDVLRTDDILHPLPLPSPLRDRQKNTSGRDARATDEVRATRGSANSRSENDSRRQRAREAEGGVNSPSAYGRASPSRSHLAEHVTHVEDLNYRAARERIGVPNHRDARSEHDAYLMPPPPSYSDAMSDAASADASVSSRLSKSEARAQAHVYAPRTSATYLTKRSNQYAAPLESDDVCTRGTATGRSVDDQPVSSYRESYTGHIYMRHSPKSSPRRTRVLAPVVLPALSTTEADHMLAHASSRLEDYFDRDDMHSVLASVASLSHDSSGFPHNGAAPPTTGSSGHAALPCDTRVTGVSAATLSSLTNSPRGAGQQASHNSAYNANPNVPADRRGWRYEEQEDGDANDYDTLRPISVTPSMERVLEAVHANTERSRNAAAVCVPPERELWERETGGASAAYEDTSASLRADLSPIEQRTSPTTLTLQRQHFSPTFSTFYTDRPSDESAQDKRRQDGAAQTSPESFTPRSEPSPPPSHTEKQYKHGNTASEDSDTRAGSALFESDGSEALFAEAPAYDDEQEEKSEHSGVSSFVSRQSNDSRSGLNEEQEHDVSMSSSQAESNAVAAVTSESHGAETTYSSAFPAELCDALPFIDYLSRVNAAGAPVLLKELSVMGDAWANTLKGTSSDSGAPVVRRDEDEVVDCLALTLLLNKPAALQHIAVPLLRKELKSAVRSMRNLADDDGGHSSSATRRTRQLYAGSQFNDGSVERDEDSNAVEPAPEDASLTASASAAHINNVLCAVIGLGSAANSLLPLLLQLLLQLPPPTPRSLCDIRLVGLAIRTTGAAEGLRALTRIVEERSEAAHVLTAAAYAISTYAHALPGHTSAVCVPAGVLQRSRNDVLYRLVPDTKAPFSSARTSSREERAQAQPQQLQQEWQLRPLWTGSAEMFSPSSTTGFITGMHLVCLQSPPPYRPTHVVIDAEAARQSLQLYIASEVFAVRHDHPYVMVLLDDALNSSLLCRVVGDVEERETFTSIWDRMRRDLHRVLSEHTTREGKMDDVTADGSGLPLPLLLYSIEDFFSDEKDMLFAVESALVHALVFHAAPLFQEQALLSLSTLPPAARVHVVQPVTDFFLKMVRSYQLRHATTMRRGSATTRDGRGGGGRHGDVVGDAERAAEEAVVVAAAMAAGTVCVNPLAPASCTSSCVASLVPVFTELLRTSQWRVRHAACIGLARIGPYTADPAAVVDLFLSLLAPASSDSILANASASESDHLPALQPATVVWCLAQQQQGGVRALLRVLQDAQESPPVHDWCAYQLANVDVHAACRGADRTNTEEADALLDEVVQVLGKLIALQGALEEDTVLLCVRALAEVVHRATAGPQKSTAAPLWGICELEQFVLPLESARSWQEAATYYQNEPLCSCFTVLTSVMEAALMPSNVLKALCFYLCKYGRCHGELYVCEMLLDGASVAARAAAAFGLRACGAKVIRSVVLGMNDVSFEVRREALDTMEVLGAANVLAVLRRRPAEHRQQVVAALRDCLLQDAGRAVARKAAEAVYQALTRDEQRDVL